MTPMMEVIRLLVFTAPVDDNDNPVVEVLRVDICSVKTLYCFRLNPFFIKLPFVFKMMLEIGLL